MAVVLTLPSPIHECAKGPNAVVVPDIDPEVLEILAHRKVSLLMPNE
jgi:hypothetical protein